MSWAGLRGAVPIVLATIPLSARLPAAQQVFDIVFVLVVVFTLVQAPALPSLARRLRVGEEEDTAQVAIESAPLGSIDADLLEFAVPKCSKLQGVAMWELRMPPGAVVSVIVRDGRPIVPDGRTTLRADDQLLLIVPSTRRRQVERRLLAVHRAGRLASWLGEQGETRQPTDDRGPQIRPRWDRAVRRLLAAAQRRAGRGSDRTSRADVERSITDAPVSR
jgi:cell volume regulation protein A